MNEMCCKQIVEFMADYLEKELPDEAYKVFEQHIKDCGCCAEFLRTYRETILLCRECMCNKPPEDRPEIPEQLVKAIMEARKRM